MSNIHPLIATSMAWFTPKPSQEPIGRDDPDCFVRHREDAHEDEPDMPSTIGADDQPRGFV